jgi:hypothetical protein
MCLPFCLRQTLWGAGPGPVAIDREVVYSDMTDWRRFGRVHDFSERKMKDVITQRRDRRGCGRSHVWVCPTSATRLAHPITLGTGSIGCSIASEGVHRLNLAQGDC